jgi:hypothetical protein
MRKPTARKPKKKNPVKGSFSSGLPTSVGRNHHQFKALNSRNPLAKKSDLILQLLQQTIQHAPVLLTEHMLNAPPNPPGFKFQPLDLGNNIGFWVINCAHRQPPCTRFTKL